MTPTLAEVDAYPVPGLLPGRIEHIHEVPADFAHGLIREAKRMLYLAVITGEGCSPSDRVDWAWHEMLMFTKFYRDLCAFLGQFLDHVPEPPSGPYEPPETWEHIQATLGVPRRGIPSYDLTKKLYEEKFGMKPDPLFWP